MRASIQKTVQYDRSHYLNEPVPIVWELKMLFKRNESLVIFEIGACEGEDSIRYSKLYPCARIYAFEPLPANIELIKNNLTKYNIKNVSFFNRALSVSNGTAQFFVSSGKPPGTADVDWDFGNKSSSLQAPEKHLDNIKFIHFDNKILVETITLNSFCTQNKINYIDFMHMDVQGAELMVLEGAGDFIKSIKAIWLEVSKIDLYKNQPLVQDIAAFMRRNNFTLLKDACGNIQGDQLYISVNFFSKRKITRIKNAIAARSLLNRLVRKVQRTVFLLAHNRK